VRAAALAALCFLPVVVLAQRQIDLRVSAFGPQGEALYLTGEQIRRLSPGFEDLMADVYWLRTVQYYGYQRLWGGQRYELLHPLVDIVTDLDSRLEIAYHYGAIFLCESHPVGAGDCPRGIALLEKGVRHNPTNWRLRQDLGFFTFTFLGDAQKGARILREAARLPGAPFWLEALAAEILQKGGDRETSRRIWRQMYEQSEVGPVKYNAWAHLRYLDALDEADALTRLVRLYEERTGRRAASLDELLRAGLLRHPPVDPAGVPFSYDRESGKVSISRQSELWRPLETGG